MAHEQDQGRYGQMQMPAMMLLPTQQFGSAFIENLQNVLDYELKLARSCTHFALNQWRDALEVRDLQSMQQFLQKQTLGVQELAQQTREGTEQLLHASQESAQRGLQLAQRATDAGTQMARQGAQQAASSSARAARGS
jgi:hypothetical protein